MILGSLFLSCRALIHLPVRPGLSTYDKPQFLPTPQPSYPLIGSIDHVSRFVSIEYCLFPSSFLYTPHLSYIIWHYILLFDSLHSA